MNGVDLKGMASFARAAAALFPGQPFNKFTDFAQYIIKNFDIFKEICDWLSQTLMGPFCLAWRNRYHVMDFPNKADVGEKRIVRSQHNK